MFSNLLLVSSLAQDSTAIHQKKTKNCAIIIPFTDAIAWGEADPIAQVMGCFQSVRCRWEEAPAGFPVGLFRR